MLTSGFKLISEDASSRESRWQEMWFCFERDRFHAVMHIPLWSIVVVTAPLPIAWESRRRSRSASGRGFLVGPMGSGEGR